MERARHVRLFEFETRQTPARPGCCSRCVRASRDHREEPPDRQFKPMFSLRNANEIRTTRPCCRDRAEVELDEQAGAYRT